VDGQPVSVRYLRSAPERSAIIDESIKPPALLALSGYPAVGPSPHSSIFITSDRGRPVSAGHVFNACQADRLGARDTNPLLKKEERPSNPSNPSKFQRTAGLVRRHLIDQVCPMSSRSQASTRCSCAVRWLR
jgi:hypothetical protein